VNFCEEKIGTVVFWAINDGRVLGWYRFCSDVADSTAPQPVNCYFSRVLFGPCPDTELLIARQHV
jgi:hypothetical protein